MPHPAKELVETALRVLVAWIHGSTPNPPDVETLRIARPSVAHLPLDELACQVIHDLNAVGAEELTPDRNDGRVIRVNKVA